MIAAAPSRPALETARGSRHRGRVQCTQPPRGPGRALPALALALATASVALLFLPLEVVFPPVRLVLEPAALQPEIGLCWRAPLHVALPSDAEGVSALRLQEDRRELQPHALHEDIRRLGGGRFSHWGDSLYLSTTDGSDPRTNGRRLEVLLAGATAVWPLGAALTGLAAASALALVGAWRRGGRLRLVLAGALLSATAAAVAAQASPLRWSSDLLAAGEALARAGPDPPGLPAPVTAGTLRLDGPLDAWRFAAPPGAPPRHAPPPPRALSLRAGEGCIPSGNGALSVPRGCWLQAGPVDDLPPAELECLEILARVEEGETLQLVFRVDERDPERPEGPVEVTVDLPVRPDGAWRTLAVTRPVELARAAPPGAPAPRLVDLRLGPGARDERVVIEVAQARLATRSSGFLAATHGLRELECGSELRPALWQGADGQLARDWPETVGAARLRFAVALAGAGRARWSVLAENAAGARRELATGEVEGVTRGGPGWRDLDVAAPEDCARLVLRAEGLSEGAALAWASLRRVVPQPAPRRVLMVLVDTLRADALSCQGGPEGATPGLDALAAAGARFASCWSQAYWTRPSMPSILTGRYVTATGVNGVAERLSDAHVTLAERFAAAGFRTLALLGNSNAGPHAGLQQGFDETRLVLRRDFVQDTRRFLDELVEPRLAALPDEDLFVLVHLMQAHGPYGPRLPPPDFVQPEGELLERADSLDRPWLARPTAEARRALYARDVSGLDAALAAWLQRRLDAWEGAPGAQPAVVCVLSDHGERLGEGGAWGHGWGPMGAEVLHVPLLLRAPGRIAPGTVCEAVVQNIDVGETLLDLAGVPRGPERSGAGRSLLDRLDARGGVALASAELDGSRLFTAVAAPGGLVGEAGRLVAAFDARGAPAPLARPDRLWQLPRGLDEVFGRTWERYLASQLAVARSLQHEPDGAVEHSPRALLDLRANGYLGGR